MGRIKIYMGLRNRFELHDEGGDVKVRKMFQKKKKKDVS